MCIKLLLTYLLTYFYKTKTLLLRLTPSEVSRGFLQQRELKCSRLQRLHGGSKRRCGSQVTLRRLALLLTTPGSMQWRRHDRLRSADRPI